MKSVQWTVYFQFIANKQSNCPRLDYNIMFQLPYINKYIYLCTCDKVLSITMMGEQYNQHYANFKTEKHKISFTRTHSVLGIKSTYK